MMVMLISRKSISRKPIARQHKTSEDNWTCSASPAHDFKKRRRWGGGKLVETQTRTWLWRKWEGGGFYDTTLAEL
jgi:hypothetical protein